MQAPSAPAPTATSAGPATTAWFDSLLPSLSSISARPGSGFRYPGQEASAPSTRDPLSKVELRIQCRNLADLDLLSKSDPQVYVFLQDVSNRKFYQIGKTEVIDNELNPSFTTPIVIDYYFEMPQLLRFVVVDIDKPGAPLTEQDLIGQIISSSIAIAHVTLVSLALSDIVGAPGSAFSRKLTRPDRPHENRGVITIYSEELRDMRMAVHLKLSAQRLDKMQFFGKADPFIRVSRVRAGDNRLLVYKSEVIKGTLNPEWKPFKLALHTLCSGDMDQKLVIECLHWNRNNGELIGYVQTTLREILQRHDQGVPLDLINPSKKLQKKGYQNSGTLQIDQALTIEEPSFIDYLRGGCEINLMVGIDFTRSNGQPKFSTSLHYNNPAAPNAYAKAIRAVGDILCHYDSDKRFPVYGFGAKLPGEEKASHCFPLTFAPNPEVEGIDGILEVYQRALGVVDLWGPTNFAPLINTAASIVGNDVSQEHQRYLILLIITDGEISDLPDTIDAVIKASSFPLSIVIVGVGNADFTNMKVLDGDDALLKNANGVAKRDIVQFVAMRDFENAHYSRIAEETLAEIPQQFLSYMESRAIRPQAARPALPYFPSGLVVGRDAHAPAPAPAAADEAITTSTSTSTSTSTTTPSSHMGIGLELPGLIAATHRQAPPARPDSALPPPSSDTPTAPPTNAVPPTDSNVSASHGALPPFGSMPPGYGSMMMPPPYGNMMMMMPPPYGMPPSAAGYPTPPSTGKPEGEQGASSSSPSTTQQQPPMMPFGYGGGMMMPPPGYGMMPPPGFGMPMPTKPGEEGAGKPSTTGEQQPPMMPFGYGGGMMMPPPGYGMMPPPGFGMPMPTKPGEEGAGKPSTTGEPQPQQPPPMMPFGYGGGMMMPPPGYGMMPPPGYGMMPPPSPSAASGTKPGEEGAGKPSTTGEQQQPPPQQQPPMMPFGYGGGMMMPPPGYGMMPPPSAGATTQPGAEGGSPSQQPQQPPMMPFGYGGGMMMPPPGYGMMPPPPGFGPASPQAYGTPTQPSTQPQATTPPSQ